MGPRLPGAVVSSSPTPAPCREYRRAPLGAEASQSPSSVENRAPPSFRGLGCFGPGSEVLSRPGRKTRGPARAGSGPGRAAGPRPDGRPWHAPGSFEAPGLSGPRWPPCASPAWGGGGSVQRRRGAGERLGRAQRGQPSVKGIVPAPQSPPAPAPSGPNSGRPAARGFQRPHICTEAGRAPRSGGRPPPPRRAGCEAICPLIMIPPHKPPPAPFNSGALANQWPLALPSGRPPRQR